MQNRQKDRNQRLKGTLAGVEFSDRYLGIPDNIYVFESCFISGQLVQRILNSDRNDNEKRKKYKENIKLQMTVCIVGQILIENFEV